MNAVWQRARRTGSRLERMALVNLQDKSGRAERTPLSVLDLKAGDRA
jgi:hypothetical protein